MLLLRDTNQFAPREKESHTSCSSSVCVTPKVDADSSVAMLKKLSLATVTTCSIVWCKQVNSAYCFAVLFHNLDRPIMPRRAQGAWAPRVAGPCFLAKYILISDPDLSLRRIAVASRVVISNCKFPRENGVTFPCNTNFY